MAARSIASLSLSFGLVSIPVKLYSATEASAGIHFNMLTRDGARVRQQLVDEKTQQVVNRADLIKGYEFEKDRYVMFDPAELKALEEGSSPTIDIVAFVPEQAIDPIYYDKAYYLAPDKRGGKPYALLKEAMRAAGKCALATWAWRGKQYVVQVRPVEDGLVVQQLLYADEVRSLKDIGVEDAKVSDAELKLALQLVEQNSRESYDPAEFRDEEKERILHAIDEKIAGNRIVQSEHTEAPAGGQVVDLMEALRRSLDAKGGAAAAPRGKTPAKAAANDEAPAAGNVTPLKERKAPKRAARAEEPATATPDGAADASTPARKRARK